MSDMRICDDLVLVDYAPLYRQVVAIAADPFPVIVSRHPKPVDPARPWRWETKNIPAADPRFRGRYHFEDCEAAWNDAGAHGFTDREVRE